MVVTFLPKENTEFLGLTAVNAPYQVSIILHRSPHTVKGANDYLNVRFQDKSFGAMWTPMAKFE